MPGGVTTELAQIRHTFRHTLHRPIVSISIPLAAFLQSRSNPHSQPLARQIENRDFEIFGFRFENCSFRVESDSSFFFGEPPFDVVPTQVESGFFCKPSLDSV